MSQRNGEPESPSPQASCLLAQRDEARSKTLLAQRKQEKAEADLKQKKEKINELEYKLGKLQQTVKVQSDQIQGPRETNTPQRGVNYRHSPVYNQPPPPYQNPIVPFHTRPDMLGLTPLQIQSSPTSRHHVVTPERPQTVVSANTAVVGVGGFHANNQWLRSSLQPPNGFHMNDGVLIPPSQGQNLPPCPPPPYSQHPNSLPGPARLHQLSSSTDLPMPYPRNSAAQSSNWRADALGPPKQTGPSGESSALVLQGQNTKEQIMWPTEFTNFFKLTEEWARNYTNAPDLTKDPALTKAVIASFAKQCNTDHVMHLLCSGPSRYLMVARMVNSWISIDLFRPEALKGFSTSIDKKIDGYRKQLDPNATTNSRCGLLRAIADTVKELTSAVDFGGCVKDRIMHQLSSLWDRVTLFLAPGIAEKQAWEDLRHIFDRAYRIVVLMLCNPFSFEFEYPSVGREYFNPSCMINRDNAYTEDPFSLHRRRLRIRLGITPVVRITDYTTPATSAQKQTVHFANVLLMQ